MRVWVMLVSCLLAVAMGMPAQAKEAASFAGTPFGTPRTSLPSFMTLKTVGHVSYAVNLNERYQVDGRTPVVFYGFADGRLFAAYVKLDGVISPEAMIKRLVATYGRPQITIESGVRILRWRKGDLKVKLKSDPSAGSLKLGYYSIAYGTPAARSLPAPDSIDMDELARMYEKDKIAKGVKVPDSTARQRKLPHDGSIANPLGPIIGQ